MRVDVRAKPGEVRSVQCNDISQLDGSNRQNADVRATVPPRVYRSRKVPGWSYGRVGGLQLI